MRQDLARSKAFVQLHERLERGGSWTSPCDKRYPNCSATRDRRSGRGTRGCSGAIDGGSTSRPSATPNPPRRCSRRRGRVASRNSSGRCSRRPCRAPEGAESRRTPRNVMVFVDAEAHRTGSWRRAVGKALMGTPGRMLLATGDRHAGGRTPRSRGEPGQLRRLAARSTATSGADWVRSQLRQGRKVVPSQRERPLERARRVHEGRSAQQRGTVP